jgi:hypothetical protein
MASPTPSSSLLPNISPPLTHVTPYDQSGVIAVLTGFSLGLLLLGTGVRLYAKRYAGILRGDNIAFYLAVVFGIVQSAVAFYLVKLGWGKVTDMLSDSDLRSIRRVRSKNRS